jgi:hypothetical protein
MNSFFKKLKDKMKRTLICIFFLFLLSIPSFAQDQSLSDNRGIYTFLINLSIKGHIIVNDETLPWSRQYIADKLIEAVSVRSSLSEIEKKELDFYLDEYNSEIKRTKNESVAPELKYLSFDKPDRFRFFHYSDSLMNFYAEPVLGFGMDHEYSENQTAKHTGINVYGSLANSFYFKTFYSDHQEDGTYLDVDRRFTDKTGFTFRNRFKGSIQYDFVNAEMTYAWKWGEVGIAKDYMQWGSGERGQLIFSTKAASFPFFKLKVSPAPWFDFMYIFGFLQSDVVDSSTIRGDIKFERLHYSPVSKYIVSHLFTFHPFYNLSFSFGESVIYSDKIEPIYFIPIIPFRISEHYVMNQEENEGGNAQMFADVRYKIPSLKSMLYASLFIDEMSFKTMFKNNGSDPTEAAYTLGASILDPVLPGSNLIFEYTKIAPYIYMHPDNAQTYANYNYQLGHWIGSNSDLIYSAYEQKIMRGLKIKFWGEYIRKGKTEKSAADLTFDPYPQFLHGPRKNVTDYGITASWEPYYSLILSVNYQHSIISDEDNERTPIYQLGSRNVLGVSLSYGL